MLKKLIVPFILAAIVVVLFVMYCPLAKQSVIEQPAEPPVVEPDHPTPPPTPKALSLDAHYSGKKRTELKSLSKFAHNHAQWMSNYGMRHSRFAEAAGLYGAMAENIAEANSWEEAYQMWRNSPGHWANMSGQYPYMAFGNVGRSYVVIYASHSAHAAAVNMELIPKSTSVGRPTWRK